MSNKEYNKRWYQKYKERIKKKAISDYWNNREVAIGRVKKRRVLFKKKYGFCVDTAEMYGLENVIAAYKKCKNRCMVCGAKSGLTIHHKDNNGIHKMEKGLPMNNNVGNLEILCRKCHGYLHTPNPRPTNPFFGGE